MEVFKLVVRTGILDLEDDGSGVDHSFFDIKNDIMKPILRNNERYIVRA